MSIIKLENVTFDYSGGLEALKGVSLEIGQGDFLCIVGENGSGKSTLIKCILGLKNINKGKIEVKERIGYLPQMTEIQNNFPATIEEIVLSGTIPNNKAKIFYTKEDKKKAREVLEQLNLYDIRKKCFYELSGGQKQRVLIARALCSTEKVIILDEPTNGLDPKIAIQIYEMLHKLNEETGLTVIMVSHDIERAIKYASRVVEMQEGKIIKDVLAKDYNIGGGK